MINKLEEIHNDSITYYLTLWYEEGSIAPEDLKRFLVDYESRLHFKTTIKVGNELKKNDFIWYDIISKKDTDMSDRIRFQYTYSSEEHTLKGLDEFPSVPNKIRNNIKEKYIKEGIEYLQNKVLPYK